MRFAILLIVALLVSACVPQIAAPTATPTETTKPTAAAVVGGATSTPPPARTATSTLATPEVLGSYDDPHDFRSFAARLDRAIETADAPFFRDHVVFEDLNCDVDFPAPPWACRGKPPGSVIRGIVAGVWASEGFGLDPDGYAAFIADFLTQADASASDGFGEGGARLYAYGIFGPEVQASDLKGEVVQAFATRITAASGSRIPGPGRSVLILHVKFDGQRWQIARLTVTPLVNQYPPAAALLDPSRPEAKGMFQYWQRWEPETGRAPARTATADVPPVGKDAAGAPGADGWKRFSSQDLGVEFEYPESCTLVVLDGSLAVGGRIELAILESKGLSLGDYVNRFADSKVKTGDWTVESIKDGVLGGQEAKTVDFRFGGTKRFGTATVAIRNGKVYVWSLTAGGFTCDEPNAYGRILSSVKFAG